MHNALFGGSVPSEKMLDNMAMAEPATEHLNVSSIQPVEGQTPVSVLDELDSYWQEQDALSVSGTGTQFGIMARQAEDMMLLSSSGKKPKRAGAFCVGI